MDNTAPQSFDPDFPPESWNNRHEFIFTEFSYPGPWGDPNLSPSFTASMAQIFLSIRYERPRKVETGMGFQSRKYLFNKRYSISAFMKNKLDGPLQ